MENQTRESIPPILRIGSLLGFGLYISVWARAFLFLKPEYNVLVTDPFEVVNTCFTDIVVLLVWILMTFTFAISIFRMLAVLARRTTLRRLFLTLLRNPGRLLHLAVVLAYDVQLIVFIYSTWTVELAVACRFLQFLPAFTLLLHSAGQQCFLAVVQGNEVYQRDTSRLASFHMVVNVTMLFHLITTGAMVGFKIRSEPTPFLSVMLMLMPLELAYRLRAIFGWRYHLTNDTRNVRNKDDCMEYLCVSYIEEQNDKMPQIVMGFELHPVQDSPMGHLVTGWEEPSFKDEATSLSNSSW